MYRSALATCLLLVGCLAPPEPESDLPASPGPVRFLVIGDMGTGEAPQYRVAQAMVLVCQERGCDFVVGTGDNIYENGAAHAYDPQFASKFEEPYAALDLPFYMTLGNHDLAQNRMAWSLGDVQVGYHYRDDKPSQKWHMPARWYVHDHGAVRFVALDTNILFGGDAEIWSRDPRGVQQGSFVSAALAEGEGRWTFIHGHHPYVSNGVHGNATPEMTEWYQEHVCDRADVLLSGHDHDLQWLLPSPTCGKTQFIVSGAAGKTRPLGTPGDHPARFQAGDVYGLAWIEVDGLRMDVAFYDDHGSLLFEGAVERLSRTTSNQR